MPVFKKPKTIEELCDEFKESVVQNAVDGITTVELAELEKFFSYTAAHYETTFVPKQIRDTLRKKGITFLKHRGRNIITVRVE